MPLVQYLTHWLPDKGLNGSFNLIEKPDFSYKSWFQGEFQKRSRWHYRDHLGHRSLMVRTYNQWVYSLYNKPRARHIIKGPENILYSDLYTKTLQGKDFLGKQSIDERAENLAKLSNWLEEKGGQLVIFQAPGKAWFHQDKLPEYPKADSTNYEVFSRVLVENGLSYFDGQALFMSMKDTSSFPLFPKNGVHWSNYGFHLALKSFGVYLNQNLGFNLPRLNLVDIEISKRARFTDQDIEDGMNLLLDLPEPALAYPKPRFSKTGTKPTALIIGDSFTWGPWNQGLFAGYFDKTEFWFYNRTAYVYGVGPVERDFANAAEILPEFDLVIFLTTDAKLASMPWGVLENVMKTWSE